MSIVPKYHSKAAKIAKMAVFWASKRPKLISRKIWMADKS